MNDMADAELEDDPGHKMLLRVLQEIPTQEIRALKNTLGKIW